MTSTARLFLLVFAALALAPAAMAPAAASAPSAAVPIVGAWWAWVSPATPVPHGTAVVWVADTKHTVTTADSLADAMAGVANDRANADDDPDTFDVALYGAPLSDSFLYEHTFATAGEKYFFCRYHVGVGMVGVVVVGDTG